MSKLQELREIKKAKDAAAKAARLEAKAAKAEYQAKRTEYSENKALRDMDRAEEREARSREVLAKYRARMAKLQAAQEKQDRLDRIKAEKNATILGGKVAINGSREGRTFAQGQIASTHGVSSEAPRWQPRPEKVYLP